jgi:PDZ domain-containing protein
VDDLDATLSDPSGSSIELDSLPAPARRRISRRWIGLGIAVLVLVAAVVAASLIKVDYYLLSPGSVRATEPLIQVQGAATYPQQGEVGFVTVTVQRATALGWALAHLDSNIDIVPMRNILGNESPDQNRMANLQAMTDSKETASAVAQKELGYDVKIVGTGALVTDVQSGGPSDGTLSPGDTIIAVDATPITRSDELSATIGAHKPGDVVTLQVQPLPPLEGDDSTSTTSTTGTTTPTSTHTRTVKLGARADDPSKGLLGVASGTRDLHYDLPVQVTIDSGSVGGPSAGLAFTLGTMDVLTSASITGGNRVASTGTINPDGSVGPVGGVHQKTLAVRESGATGRW